MKVFVGGEMDIQFSFNWAQVSARRWVGSPFVEAARGLQATPDSMEGVMIGPATFVMLMAATAIARGTQAAPDAILRSF